MKKRNYLFLALLALVLAGCNSTSNLDALLKTYPAASEAQCQDKEGYWYKEKCWANFDDFDDNIAASDIDAEVERRLARAKKFGMSLDKKDYKLDQFIVEPNEEENKLAFITLFTKEGKTQTLVQSLPLDASESEQFSVDSFLFDADLTTARSEGEEAAMSKYLIARGKADVVVSDEHESLVLAFTGELDLEKDLQKASQKDASTIPYTVNASMELTSLGNSTVVVKGNEAYLNGTLGTMTYKQIKDLIQNHPEVKTIVLKDVPGSLNDAVNMHTGRLIKNAGLNTKILADSEIASGGVDLFCSGKQRIVTKGARVGVHSWSGGDYTAIELPKDHPAHQYQIAYFNEVLGAPQGEAFYFYTLEAAPFDGVHWMSMDEIEKWNVATQIVDR